MGVIVMKKDNLTKLLSAVLDSQLESGKHKMITQERLREVLTTGPSLAEEEKKVLLLSPVARDDYARMRDKINKELNERLQLHGVNSEILPLAAATVDDKVVIKGADFNVTLFNKTELGIPWVILIQLGSSYLRTINPMTKLRLVDSGGLEWLRGRPDSNGELTGAWQDDETDLLKRMRRFTLFLEPV
ncbi:MAG: hypothetical protein CSA32_04130 [Desulfobulbus propionicus]|nr:MAG: hypothetical protein CSA32_04130 [Desulfobulbus propionicus]